ncbi:hypothetical protein Tco_1478632 [Tanacetum coccineum]
MAIPPRYQRHQYLRSEGLGYTDADIINFKERLGRIYGKEIHRVQEELERTSEAFILALGLHTAEVMEVAGFGAYLAERDFLGPRLNTSITVLMLRLCHMLIACNIAGRSQAPKKVTVTDLFYLRGMDVSSVNIPYLLARYFSLFSSRRKRGAMIFGAMLVRLQICKELDDTWAWVAPRPEKRQVATTGALEVTKGDLDVDEGD